MVLLHDESQVEACFGTIGDSANLDARRCTFCVEHITSSKIILDVPNGTPSDVGHLESRFGLFRDIVSVSAR
jgi:hypothetical protein